jgi:hypothetical protein
MDAYVNKFWLNRSHFSPKIGQKAFKTRLEAVETG